MILRTRNERPSSLEMQDSLELLEGGLLRVAKQGEVGHEGNRVGGRIIPY